MLPRNVSYCALKWGISNYEKKIGFFSIANSFIVVLTIYIRTLFYFEIEKNKKKRQGKTKYLIRRKIYRTGFELTNPDSRDRCSHHCALQFTIQ